MSKLTPPVHRAIICVDVERFGDRNRTHLHQLTVRDGLYAALTRAFTRSGVSWEDCYREDCGDGVLILVPSDVPKNVLAVRVLPELTTALAEHNQENDFWAMIRLRLAMHAGEIHHDDHGVVGTAINVAFRLLEARELRETLLDSSGSLAVIASQWFYEEVIRHDPSSNPAEYRRVEISVKETRDTAWICRPDDPYPPAEDTTFTGKTRAPGILTVAPPVGRLDRSVRGRESLLGSLMALLGEQDSGVHVLHGMGGCGKTTIALEMASYAAAQEMSVWWVSAVDKPTLSAGMREVAASLGAPADLIERAWSGHSSAVDLLWRLLADTDRPWLLVVDNADEPENLAPSGGFLAEGTGWIRPCTGLPGTIIVTSRDGNQVRWGTWCTLHHVDVLGESDAAQVLLDLAGEEAGSRSDAVRLARRLGGLPLALRFAGAYLNATSSIPEWPGTRIIRTYAAYREALDDHFAELLDENPLSDPTLLRSTVPLVQTWEFSLDLLARRGIDEARNMMRLLSCMGDAPIPFLCILRPDRLSSSELFRGLTPDRLSATLRALGDLGLLEFHVSPDAPDEVTSRTLQVHPLVRDANRRQEDLAEHQEAYAVLVADLFVTASSGLSPDDPADWPMWHLLIPHCDSPLALIKDSDTPRPDLVAHALRAAVAGVRHLFRVGWLDQAEAILNACRIAEKGSGPGPINPDALAVRSCTAHLLQLRGRLSEAETMLRTVMADTQTIFGAGSPESTDVRYDLAELLDYRGRMAEAAEEYRTVFAARESSLGHDAPQTLAARKGVARVFRQRGRLRAAEEEYRLVLEAYQKSLGERHLDTLATRLDLAQVLHDRGLFRQAEYELRMTLAICQESLGTQHPSTLAVRHELADVLRDRGLLREAESEFRTVLNSRKTIYGEDHPDTVASRYGLATVLRDRGWPGDAEQEFREVLEIRRKLLGDRHPSTLAVRHGLADLLVERRSLQEAEAEFREVYQARREVLGEQHLLTLSVRHGAAYALQMRGMTEQAETEYRTVIADCIEVLGPRHPGTLAVRHRLADLLVERRSLQEAEAEFREVYQARREVLGEQHPDSITSRNSLDEVIQEQQHSEERELERKDSQIPQG